MEKGLRASESKKNTQKSIWSVASILKRGETGTVGAALLLFIIFTLTSNSFLTAYNLFNISRTLALFVLIAASQAVVLVIGGMNLSVGSIGGLSVVIFGFFIDTAGLPITIAWPIGILVGAACGLFNGLVITKLKINSFIVTLSTLFLFRGIKYGISKGYPFKNIPEAYTQIGRTGVGFISYLFLITIAVLIVVWYVYRFTIFGRKMLATGCNLEAAALSGINTDKVIVSANVLSGVLAAFVGLLWVSRIGSVQAATGDDWLVISFAVAIIGGTGLNGGKISAVSLLAGGIIMVLIKNGLILLQANIYFEQAFLGAIVLLTVAIDRFREAFNARRSTDTAK